MLIAGVAWGWCSGHDETEEASLRHWGRRDGGPGESVPEALDGASGGRGGLEISGRW